VEHVPQRIERNLRDRTVGIDARVVHEHVDPAGPIDDRLDGRADRRLVLHVELQGVDALRGEVSDGLGTPRGFDGTVATRPDVPRERPSDPGRAPGDENYLPFE